MGKGHWEELNHFGHRTDMVKAFRQRREKVEKITLCMGVKLEGAGSGKKRGKRLIGGGQMSIPLQ